MERLDTVQPSAAALTRAASKQTYYTVRWLVDRERVPVAYQAYAYFRWLDDQLDGAVMGPLERTAFVERQKALMHNCYREEWPRHPGGEERLLIDLIRGDASKNSGLWAYIRNMMAVMAFDAQRRGQLITQNELAKYTRSLATAVTEALHYFVGHNSASPRSEARYLAATGAHITHMLRDTLDDIANGYFNVPREFLEAYAIAPQEVGSEAYRAWVKSRVRVARACFEAGKDYLAQVENLRCRIAGYAYIARFEEVLATIEREGYRLRSEYPECKRLSAGLGMGWSVLKSALRPQKRGAAHKAGQYKSLEGKS